jgi:hypothetical protein
MQFFEIILDCPTCGAECVADEKEEDGEVVTLKADCDCCENIVIEKTTKSQIKEQCNQARRLPDASMDLSKWNPSGKTN